MAVGYVDGNINVFELTNNEIVCVFAGHKSAITCLQYDEQGHRLVSGSKVKSLINMGKNCLRYCTALLNLGITNSIIFVKQFAFLFR